MDPEQKCYQAEFPGWAHVVGHNAELAARWPQVQPVHCASKDRAGGEHSQEPRPELGALTLTGGAQGPLRGCRASSGDGHRLRLPLSFMAQNSPRGLG